MTMALPLGIVNPAAFEGGVEKAYENCVSATMGTGPYMFDRVEEIPIPLSAIPTTGAKLLKWTSSRSK